jgi:hypothetical protein
MTDRQTKVFVIQVPARRDGPRGGWVEKYDLSAAGRFGALVRVLAYGHVPIDPEPTIRRLNEAFTDFDPELDHVLLLGDPVAMAQAVALLARRFPSGFKALKWDRRADCYVGYRVG